MDRSNKLRQQMKTMMDRPGSTQAAATGGEAKGPHGESESDGDSSPNKTKGYNRSTKFGRTKQIKVRKQRTKGTEWEDV